MRKRTRLAIGLSLLLALAGMRQADKPPITVYVEADSGDSEAVSKPKATAKDISDSAEDLRRQIEKRRDIALAVHPETADIVVTIVDREIQIAQSRQAEYVGGYTQNHYQSRHIITYRIEAGKSSHKAEYFNAGSFVTWNRVAAGLSKHIERWAKDHFEELLQYRLRH